MAMTMFSKAATASFTTASTTKAQRRGAVAVRAGPYDAELIQTAVSFVEMRGGRLEILACWCILSATILLQFLPYPAHPID
jgi:hypothetical protein